MSIVIYPVSVVSHPHKKMEKVQNNWYFWISIITHFETQFKPDASWIGFRHILTVEQ